MAPIVHPQWGFSQPQFLDALAKFGTIRHFWPLDDAATQTTSNDSINQTIGTSSSTLRNYLIADTGSTASGLALNNSVGASTTYGIQAPSPNYNQKCWLGGAYTASSAYYSMAIGWWSGGGSLDLPGFASGARVWSTYQTPVSAGGSGRFYVMVGWDAANNFTAWEWADEYHSSGVLIDVVTASGGAVSYGDCINTQLNVLSQYYDGSDFYIKYFLGVGGSTYLLHSRTKVAGQTTAGIGGQGTAPYSRFLFCAENHLGIHNQLLNWSSAFIVSEIGDVQLSDFTTLYNSSLL